MRRLFLSALLYLLSAQAWASDEGVMGGTVTVARMENELWRATYCFDEPVEIFGFERPVTHMRETHWSAVTDGLELRHNKEDTSHLQPVGGGTFTCGAVDIKPFTDLPVRKDYYAFTPFSSGGYSVYTGYLEGRAYVRGVWQDVDFKATYTSLAHEAVIAPHLSELGHQFVYFGPKEFVETDEAVLIIDEKMPERARRDIVETMAKTSALLPGVFGHKPKEKYIIFMAAGRLNVGEGSSIKGGTGPRQIRFTLEGKGAARLAENDPLFYPKLTVHEVLHLWQGDVWHRQLGNDRQWVHEGGADAVAYEMMYLSGLYDQTEYEKTWRDVEGKCIKLLGKSSVHGGVEARSNDVLYQCGAFANYLVGSALNMEDPGRGILAFWKAMAEWDKEKILSTPSEDLFFLTMEKLGLSNGHVQALKVFLSEKPADPAEAVSYIKGVFGLRS